MRRFLGEEVEPVVEPEPGDHRFDDEDWSQRQYFDFWKQAYLLTSHWIEDLVEKTLIILELETISRLKDGVKKR